MNPGPPALYLLNTERRYIDGNEKKVRRWTYGQKAQNKQNKVILMVGETGAGKTSIINTMTNYLLGVKFEDEEFYQITEEEHNDQSQSQTSEITVYEVFAEENPISLTVIDTPGYGDTGGYEKDEVISKYLSKLFSDEDGIHEIDIVCFVMKASQNRLSDKELYLFHSVLSLFGRDIKNNIVFLLTHSDGGPPTDALNAINAAEMPCRRDEDNEPVHFLFNNRQKEQRDQRYRRVLKSSWEMGEESMSEFMNLLNENNRKSLQMTLDVLKERSRLEACVSNLKDRITERELKTDEVTQIQEAIKQNKDKIEKCEDFHFTVNRVFKEKVFIQNESRWNQYATCCNVCQENCHEWGCWWVKDVSKCSVMKNDHCTACTGKCHYSKHVKENKKYVMKIKKVTMTFDELKQEYNRTGEMTEISFVQKKEPQSSRKHSGNKTETEENLSSKLEMIKTEKSNLLHEAYVSIMSLSKIALKADSAFTLQHLDFLISKLKEEGKSYWMKNLEEMRKAIKELKNTGAFRYL
ncbi:hypothetical protein M9458_055570, partial [Cirrhinus mrigala]